MEEDSYEKNVVMYVSIGEPRHIAGNNNINKSIRYWAIAGGCYVGDGLDFCLPECWFAVFDEKKECCK